MLNATNHFKKKFSENWFVATASILTLRQKEMPTPSIPFLFYFFFYPPLYHFSFHPLISENPAVIAKAIKNEKVVLGAMFTIHPISKL